ncbi:MAG: hypothetical protein LLG04_17810 [Parachlamydia sp.]|nr:hypothetical protein [Parachlamydia sp.]
MNPDKARSLEERLDIIQQHFKKYKISKGRRFAASVPADNAKWLMKAVQPHFEKSLFSIESHPLQMNQVDQAIAILPKLRNASEKNRSLELIISHLLDRDPKKALMLWNQLTFGRDRWAKKIAETLLKLGQHQDALDFSLSFENVERDNLLRSMAIWYANKLELDQALEIVHTIDNPDIQAYAKSNIVHTLSHQKQFQKAKEIALSIQDRGYREDAILYIVKAYLQDRYVDEAIQFVDSFKNTHEKAKPAKVIAAALKAQYQDEKVREVRKIFSLIPAPTRQAA